MHKIDLDQLSILTTILPQVGSDQLRKRLHRLTFYYETMSYTTSDSEISALAAEFIEYLKTTDFLQGEVTTSKQMHQTLFELLGIEY